MNDSLTYKVTKVIEAIGFKVIKITEGNSESDPIRIYLDNIPPEWNSGGYEIWHLGDGIEDGFHNFMDLNFITWEISKMDGELDGIPGKTWVFIGLPIDKLEES